MAAPLTLHRTRGVERIIDAVAVDNSPEVVSDPIKLAEGLRGDAVQPGSLYAEAWLTAVNPGTTDDLRVRIYPCRSAVLGDRDSDPAKEWLLPTSGTTPYIKTLIWDFRDVMTGFVLGLLVNGSTDTLTCTVKLRLYSWKEGA